MRTKTVPHLVASNSGRAFWAQSLLTNMLHRCGTHTMEKQGHQPKRALEYWQLKSIQFSEMAGMKGVRGEMIGWGKMGFLTGTAVIMDALPQTRPLDIDQTGSWLAGCAAASVEPALGADNSTCRCPGPAGPLAQLLSPSPVAAAPPCSPSPLWGRSPPRWTMTAGGARLASQPAAELAAMAAELSRSAIISRSARSEPAQICRGEGSAQSVLVGLQATNRDG